MLGELALQDKPLELLKYVNNVILLENSNFTSCLPKCWSVMFVLEVLLERQIQACLGRKRRELENNRDGK